jgi:hypothetical protein
MLMAEALRMVMEEYMRGIAKHGDWSNYSEEQMMSAIINELMVEAGDAEQRGDIHGPHGMIRELAQVAACSIKAMVVLSGREVSVPMPLSHDDMKLVCGNGHAWFGSCLPVSCPQCGGPAVGGGV